MTAEPKSVREARFIEFTPYAIRELGAKQNGFVPLYDSDDGRLIIASAITHRVIEWERDEAEDEDEEIIEEEIDEICYRHRYGYPHFRMKNGGIASRPILCPLKGTKMEVTQVVLDRLGACADDICLYLEGMVWFLGAQGWGRKDLSPEQKLSRSLARQAVMDIQSIGKITVVCPKCGQTPVVEIDSHRLWVRCSCGFIKDVELLEI